MNNLPGYREARRLASTHYENFPVLSRFIRKELRDDVAIVYWFARTADDFADEGSASEGERLQQLTLFEEQFRAALAGAPPTALHKALANTIREKRLQPDDFLALLSAFRQDVHKKRYRDMEELLDYCSRSANPVGRIILDLHGIHDESSKKLSDSICTALQLTNFWQDVSIDLQKGRIYVPVSFQHEFSLTENDFEPRYPRQEFKNCMNELCRLTNNLFAAGKPLIRQLPKPLKYEIAWTLNGGKIILEKIEKNEYTVALERLTLTKIEYLKAAIRAVIHD
jgi:squalene synthase HpnC